MNSPTDFSGTFELEDVSILLRPIQIPTTDVAEKERLIQSGERHYSEMISPEAPPSEHYLSLFHAAVDRNAKRFATDLVRLAEKMIESVDGNEITLVSLARAGTPVGVLLGRTLRHLGYDCRHYSISIIRDRGVDTVALDRIRQEHADNTIRFVDGWTGKGVISRELRSAVVEFNEQRSARLDHGLFAVADLCGHCRAAATSEDYLIPSAILGATIAGLISRSILNERVVSLGSYHGCLFMEQMAPYDLSQSFVNRIWQEILDVLASGGKLANAPFQVLIGSEWLHDVRQTYAISNPHFVKPGVCEATRVLLRRVPDRLIVRSADDPELDHLVLLANQKCVPIDINPNLPVRALALIKSLPGT